MNARFQLETLSVPWWIRCMWYLIALAVISPAFIQAAIDLKPTALLWIAAAAAMIGVWEWWVRRCIDPDRNYVDLDQQGFEVEEYALPWPIHQSFKYADVASFEARATHGLGWWERWPTRAKFWQPHVDVRLNRVVLIGRPIPLRWVKMLHLAVKERDAFVRELQARLPASQTQS
jgi:hypothetical protein